ncbi:MAG: hypothetical protein WBA74_22125, partial [Cyclobacteriaceae bacterium]
NMLGKLEDKQRIIISGTEGKEEVFNLVNKVLKKLKKPFVSFKAGQHDSTEIGSEPVAIILCEVDDLPDYHHHIALITNIKDKGIRDFDRYVRNFEKMVDNTPKAGSVIYNEDDNISAVICKKERPDVGAFGFSAPAIKHNNDETIFAVDKDEIILRDFDDSKALYVNAAYALLKRLTIQENDFINVLEK